MARVFKHSKTLLDAGWGGQLLLWAPVWQFPSPNPCPMFTKNPSQSSPIITVLTISVLHQTTRNPFYAAWDQIRVKSHLSRFFLEAIARLLSIPNCSGQWEFSPDSENDFWLILQIFRASPWPKPQLCIIMGAYLWKSPIFGTKKQSHQYLQILIFVTKNICYIKKPPSPIFANSTQRPSSHLFSLDIVSLRKFSTHGYI